MNIGKQIRRIRRDKDLTQAKVAEMINMPICNYSHKEKNDLFTRNNLYAICKALDLEITISQKLIIK